LIGCCPEDWLAGGATLPLFLHPHPIVFVLVVYIDKYSYHKFINYNALLNIYKQ